MSIAFRQLLDEPFPVEHERHYLTRLKMNPNDHEAKEYIITHLLREAVLYLRALCKSQIEDGELVNMGYRALERAVRNFEPGHGRVFQFAKQAMRGFVAEYWRSLETVRRAHTVDWETAEQSQRSVNKHPDLDDVEATAELEGRTEPDFSTIDINERWIEIEHAMSTLTDFERAIVLFIRATDLSFREVADEFGVSRAWVGLTWNRAVAKIRIELAKNP